MEEVAGRADVGVGTLYNYFGSKERLLLALFQSETAELLAAGKPIVEEPGSDPVQALVALSRVYLGWVELYDRAVLREILAASLVQPQDVVSELMSLDFQLMGQLAQLLTKLEAEGLVAAGLDVEAAAELLYGATVIPLMAYVSSAELDAEWLHRTAERQVALVFRGLRPTCWKDRP